MSFLKQPLGARKYFTVEFLNEKIAENKIVKLYAMQREYLGKFIDSNDVTHNGFVRFKSIITGKELLLKITEIELIKTLN